MVGMMVGVMVDTMLHWESLLVYLMGLCLDQDLDYETTLLLGH